MSPLGRYYFLAFIKVSYKLVRLSTAYAELERPVYITKVWNKDHLLMTSTFRGMVHMAVTMKEHVAGSLI